MLSLALTIEAYLLVVNHSFSASILIGVILALAITQLLVQLFYFLHLDQAVRAPWNILIFLFMGLVVSIVVFGSLWIMQNLNYNMSTRGQTPAQIDQYIQHDEGIEKEL
jgi:cytochrome o ubiquinol oxidase operon protein cyoD